MRVVLVAVGNAHPVRVFLQMNAAAVGEREHSIGDLSLRGGEGTPLESFGRRRVKPARSHQFGAHQVRPVLPNPLDPHVHPSSWFEGWLSVILSP